MIQLYERREKFEDIPELRLLPAEGLTPQEMKEEENTWAALKEKLDLYFRAA